MIFGDKVTRYTVYTNSESGYMLRLETSPVIKQITSIQVVNKTVMSDVTMGGSELVDLFRYPRELDTTKNPDVAFAIESGSLFIFFNASKFPYEEDTQFLILGQRYPTELINMDSKLDLATSDVELFLTLSIAIAAELQGKLVPQRLADKINYLRTVLEREKN